MFQLPEAESFSRRNGEDLHSQEQAVVAETLSRIPTTHPWHPRFNRMINSETWSFS